MEHFSRNFNKELAICEITKKSRVANSNGEVKQMWIETDEKC